MDTEIVPAEAAKGPAKYSVPALEKGLDILQLLAGSGPGMSLTAIAGALGKSTGELYRIIQYLDHRGYVVRNWSDDTYALSMQLFHMSHEHPAIRSLVSVAAPVMEDLAAEAGQSCHLAVLSRTNVTIVAQTDSPLPIRYSVRLGAQFPVWEASSGILVCAFLSDSARRTLRGQLIQLIGDDALAEFDRKAEEVRAAGHEERQSIRIAGIVNLSFPVFDRSAQLAASLTVPFLLQRSSSVGLAEVRELVRRASDRISQGLGFRLPDAG